MDRDLPSVRKGQLFKARFNSSALLIAGDLVSPSVVLCRQRVRFVTGLVLLTICFFVLREDFLATVKTPHPSPLPAKPGRGDKREASLIFIREDLSLFVVIRTTNDWFLGGTRKFCCWKVAFIAPREESRT